MLKIVECFSLNNIARITLHFDKISEIVDENNVIINNIVLNFVKKIDIKLIPYKNYNEILKISFNFKLKYLNYDGYLFLVSNELDKLGIRFVPRNNSELLYKIQVDNNVIYENTDKTLYNPDILEKINLVYKKVKNSINKDSKVVCDVVNAIRRSYENTGIILPTDLKWLNYVYNKFK